MPRRRTGKLNIPVVLDKIKAEFRHNVLFCIKMGREDHKTWVSDWCRNPPKNLPSPEEAAKMCILLNTTPEEILLHKGANESETVKCQKDIELVRSLVEQKRAEGIKKERPADGEALSDMQLEAIEFVKSLPEDRLKRFLRLAKAAFEEDGK